MNTWLFHQSGFTRTSLSSTVTRVSNFVEENVCVWCVFTSSRLPVPVDSVTQCPTQQVKYVDRNALSMFKCTVLLLNQVEGRLKSLKIQHRFFS